MSLHDEIDPPCEAAVFADTGWERQQTYENIEFCKEYARDFGMKIHTVRHGNIKEDLLSQEKMLPIIPFFVESQKDSPVMMRRQCTAWYKINPIQKFVREFTGCTYKNPVQQWIGISVDEVSRMKPSRVKYMIHRFPLIEKRLNRGDCYAWLKKNGFTIPSKSACVGCPFHSNEDWNSLSDTELQDVSDFEKQAQSKGLKYIDESERYYDSTPYLHRSCQPISEKPFETKSKAQLELDLKTEECEGGCFL